MPLRTGIVIIVLTIMFGLGIFAAAQAESPEAQSIDSRAGASGEHVLVQP